LQNGWSLRGVSPAFLPPDLLPGGFIRQPYPFYVTFEQRVLVDRSGACRIVTTLQLPAPLRGELEALGTVTGPEHWEDELGDAEALLSLLSVRVDRSLLERAPNLRVIANAAVGYDNLDVGACRERGIVVTNTPNVLTDATADIALALILSAVRRLPQAEASLRAGQFRQWEFWGYLGGDIQGSTLGIFGMGRIGQAVARRARQFGMRLIYNSRTRIAPELEVELGLTWVDWETLLETSDILTLHAPGTQQTQHLIDATSLRRMKRGSYLINTARGSLVDEAALVQALSDGHLAGAGLDVYEQEPEVHPGLLTLPNVTLLPHIGSATPNTRRAMASLAIRNIEAVLSGRPPLTPVL
jgi:glyoxylate reductase